MALASSALVQDYQEDQEGLECQIREWSKMVQSVEMKGYKSILIGNVFKYINYHVTFQICLNQTCVSIRPLKSYTRCPADSQNIECSGRGVRNSITPFDLNRPFSFLFRFAQTKTHASAKRALWAPNVRQYLQPLVHPFTPLAIKPLRIVQLHLHLIPTHLRTHIFVSCSN